MSETLGLERLPHSVRHLVQQAAGNLLDAANQLDAVLHGDAAALDALELAERNGERIVHDLVDQLGARRRYGPDRERIISLAQAIDDVVDDLEELAWAWHQQPVPGVSAFVLGIRDMARAGAWAARSERKELPARLKRFQESAAEARRLGRQARAWLLADQADPAVAIAGEIILRHAGRAITSAGRLRSELHRREFA